MPRAPRNGDRSDKGLKQEMASLREQVAEMVHAVETFTSQRPVKKVLKTTRAKPPANPLEAWVDQIVAQRFGTMTKIAQAIGVEREVLKVWKQVPRDGQKLVMVMLRRFAQSDTPTATHES